MIAHVQTVDTRSFLSFRAAWVRGYRNPYSHFVSSFQVQKALGFELVFTSKKADYWIHINEWVWLKSQFCLILTIVHLSSVLESRLQ